MGRVRSAAAVSSTGSELETYTISFVLERGLYQVAVRCTALHNGGD